jgi:hypothetical protein
VVYPKDTDARRAIPADRIGFDARNPPSFITLTGLRPPRLAADPGRLARRVEAGAHEARESGLLPFAVAVSPHPAA